MMDRRSMIRSGGAVAFGALAIGTVTGGATPAQASELPFGGFPGTTPRTPLPDPATTPVPNPPLPRGLAPFERHNLKTFDELDFDVFSSARWDRMGESHAANIRVHMPDGTLTDGLDAHIAALKALFLFAPDTRIKEHPLRLAMNELTAVTGVLRGTFTQPLPTPAGPIPPTGKKFALNMATVGVWNRRGVMDEEFLFWDNQAFNAQLGLG